MRDNSWGTPPTSRSIHTVFSFMSHSYRWRIILKYHIRGIPLQKRWFYPFPSIINSYFMSGIPNAIMIHKDLCCGYCPFLLRRLSVIALEACSPDGTPRLITQMLHPRHQPPAGYFCRVNADNARVRPVCWFGISHDCFLHP